MSKVIDFLERMGQDGQLRYASGAELEQALVRADIDPALREAICAASQQQLEAVLGAATNVCCMVRHPEFDEEQEGEGFVPVDADRSHLEALLGISGNVCCMVHHPEFDADESDVVIPVVDRRAG